MDNRGDLDKFMVGMHIIILSLGKDIAGYSGQIPVAVKTLISRNPDVIKKFYEEAELMKKFSHPNVVSLLGKGCLLVCMHA